MRRWRTKPVANPDDRSYREVAHDVIEAILTDMSNRGGLQNAWDEIDVGTQEDIREEWRKLVLQAMGVEV